MELSNFQRKAVLLIFISILVGAILLARKEPLKTHDVRSRSSDSTPAVLPTPVSTKIDINTADISQIMQIPGIGPGLAKGIISHRPYSTMNDLLKVPGIGEKRLSRIKDMIALPETKDERDQDERGPASLISSGVFPIDLNKATTEQLMKIHGIGQKTAQAIIEYREKKGRFNNLEELLRIPRIGSTTYNKLKEYIYVQSAAAEDMFEVKPRTSRLYDSRIEPGVKCPHCGKQLWEKGRRKQEYIRCPHCLKLL